MSHQGEDPVKQRNKIIPNCQTSLDGLTQYFSFLTISRTSGGMNELHV